MNISALLQTLDLSSLGQQMHALAAELYPICRSITGEGLRQTLAGVSKYLPLQTTEVPSGSQVFDWTVPREWNIRDAYIKNSRGERVVDFRKSNLHVLNYSVPVRQTMSLAELKPHLFSLPDQPDLVPYRTSYYSDKWGFCLPHRQLLSMPEDQYDVCIDSTLEAGHLTYGEHVLPGETEDEVLISCHACHPSLANDNLSGIAVATYLGRLLAGCDRRYTYRFVFIPATIGAITWLARNQELLPRIKHGLVIVCVGDPGKTTYKRTRDGNAEIDRIAKHVLQHSGADYKIEPFFPYGYDERQYCSPGINLSVGCLMRTPHGEFPEYHTSADNLDFIRPAFLADSLGKVIKIIATLEGNRRYRNLSPKCEPQLGKRGLYGSVGGQFDMKSYQLALLWVLNQCDGGPTLLDIAEKSGFSFEVIRHATDALVESGLLQEVA